MDGIDAIIIRMGKQMEELKKEASKHIYCLREETCEKLNAIRQAFSDRAEEMEETFDAVANTACVEVRDYVFDTFDSDLQTAFALADTIAIDAMSNGLVCISLVIQNAAEMLV